MSDKHDTTITTIGRPIQVPITLAGIDLSVTLYVDYRYLSWGKPGDAEHLWLSRIMTVPVAEQTRPSVTGLDLSALHTLMDDARGIDHCADFDAATGRDTNFPEGLELYLMQAIITAGAAWEKPTE
jgi:hypothetical protein